MSRHMSTQRGCVLLVMRYYGSRVLDEVLRLAFAVVGSVQARMRVGIGGHQLARTSGRGSQQK